MGTRAWLVGSVATIVAFGGAPAVVRAADAPAVGAARFASAVVVSRDRVGEPGIASGPDGTLYVNAPVGIAQGTTGAPSLVWRSTDGGRSWHGTGIGLRRSLPGGGDADLSVDQQTGRVYLTDLWLTSATVSISDDKGTSWVGNLLQGVVDQDRPWIAAGRAGVVYHLTHQMTLGKMVSKSVDGGLTFLQHSIAANTVDEAGCPCPSGNLIVRPRGALLGLTDEVGFAYPTDFAGLRFARSVDGGLTFRSTTIAPHSDDDLMGSFPIVANDGDRVYAVWIGVSDRFNRSVVWFNRSNDFGATWGTPQPLVATGGSVFPWIAARHGQLAITFLHTINRTASDHAPDGAIWRESYLGSTDSGATWTPLAEIDPTPVKVGPICTDGTACAGNRELGDFQSVTIDPGGRVDAVWTRSIDNVAQTEVRFATGCAGCQPTRRGVTTLG